MSVDSQLRVRFSGDVEAQAEHALTKVQGILEAAGGSLRDVVDVMSFHADADHIDQVFSVARRFFASDFPAWTPIVMTGTLTRGALVSIRAVADLGSADKVCITPDTIKWWQKLPASAGCRKGNYLYIAGQFGSDADGDVNTPGDHGGQARNALNRVAEICSLAGGSLGDVLGIWSFHQDPRGIDLASPVYEDEFFVGPTSEPFPARTPIGTPALYRLGMLGQYRAIADMSLGARVASPSSASWWERRHASPAVRKETGSLVAVSGQVASSAEGDVLYPGDPDAQARAAFDQMGWHLEQLGGTFKDLVEIISFHKDLRSLRSVLDVGGEYFGELGTGPAWTPVGSTGFWDEGHLVSIQGLAVV